MEQLEQPQPIRIFTIAFDPTTGRASLAGNISSQDAMQLLQQLIIAAAVEEAKLHLQEASNGK